MPRSEEAIRLQQPSPNSPLQPGQPASMPAARDMLAALSTIPEESVWLQKQKFRAHPRRLRLDVADFISTVGIKSLEDFRRVELSAVLAWLRSMECSGYKTKTIRRRLSALSSLFTHLAQKGLVDGNPVREAPRPNVNRKQGTTAAFSTKEARALLDAPPSSRRRKTRTSCIYNNWTLVG